MSHWLWGCRKTGLNHSNSLADFSETLVLSIRAQHRPCLFLNEAFQWLPTALSVTAKLPTITSQACH